MSLCIMKSWENPSDWNTPLRFYPIGQTLRTRTLVILLKNGLIIKKSYVYQSSRLSMRPLMDFSCSSMSHIDVKFKLLIVNRPVWFDFRTVQRFFSIRRLWGNNKSQQDYKVKSDWLEKGIKGLTLIRGIIYSVKVVQMK